MPTLEQIRRSGTRTKRECAGLYTVTTPAAAYLSVTLERRDDLGGWMAISQWDRHLYTDVCPTKANAKFNAILMIESAASA